ncbi:MAG: hypothetical protein Q8891_05285 [Bacteroidota bacterium]|nr:hypothetical protein [Bacteroidota bacterium]
MNHEETFEKKSEMITNVADLSLAIKNLERKKILMEDDLKDQAHSIIENLKPANILKHTLHEIQESSHLKNNIVKIIAGLGAGYFSRKLIVGKSAGFLKKALGTAIQYGITQFVAKSDDDEKDNIASPVNRKSLLKRIFSI